MNKLITYLKRFVPAYVEIRSLYWVERDAEMKRELATIFDMIDTERYILAYEHILAFKRKWDGQKLPAWLEPRRDELTRAEVMVELLERERFNSIHNK